MKFPRKLLLLLSNPSRPARGAWVEILLVLAFPLKLLSRPARGAWVEIFPMGERFAALTVAPRKGRVG